MPRKFPFMWCFLFVKILTINYTYLSPNVWQNGSSDQPFLIIFSKKETMYMFRRWCFSVTLKEFLKNSNPLQSYCQNSNLSPSKPPLCTFGGANSSINTVECKCAQPTGAYRMFIGNQIIANLTWSTTTILLLLNPEQREQV